MRGIAPLPSLAGFENAYAEKSEAICKGKMAIMVVNIAHLVLNDSLLLSSQGFVVSTNELIKEDYQSLFNKKDATKKILIPWLTVASIKALALAYHSELYSQAGKEVIDHIEQKMPTI